MQFIESSRPAARPRPGSAGQGGLMPSKRCQRYEASGAGRRSLGQSAYVDILYVQSIHII